MVISNHAKGPVATVETSGDIMIFARKILQFKNSG